MLTSWNHPRGTLLGILGLLINLSAAHAQPWMATRNAENCAACHAPGRINRDASERRCTLSCQGCHVNPNGGGIRNQYGVWNQQRWLRSFYVDGLFTNRKLPAPFNKQLYAKPPTPHAKLTPKGTRQLASETTPHAHHPYPLAVIDAGWTDSRAYDRSDHQERITAKTEEEFLEHVPEGDPYREERRLPITAGGEARYMAIKSLGQSGPLSRKFLTKTTPG